VAEQIEDVAFAPGSRGPLARGGRLALIVAGSLLAFLLWQGSADAAGRGCTFTGAPWSVDGQSGKAYYMTVLRGVSCADAVALARPLTSRSSVGADAPVPGPRGWMCQSFAPYVPTIAIGGCVKGAKAVSWANAIAGQVVSAPSSAPSQAGSGSGHTGASSSVGGARGSSAAAQPPGGGVSPLVLVVVALVSLTALALVFVARPRLRFTLLESLASARSYLTRSPSTRARTAPDRALTWGAPATDGPDAAGVRLLQTIVAEPRRPLPAATEPPGQERPRRAAAPARTNPPPRRDSDARTHSERPEPQVEPAPRIDVGARVSGILAAAQDTARTIVAAAQAEAERLRAEADAEAEGRKREAFESAAHITAEAEGEASAVVAAAVAEAERVRNEITAAAEERRREAQESAARMTADAAGEANAVVAAAQAEADRVRAEAAAAEQRRRVAEEEAARLAAEAAAQAEADRVRAEADRARAEAAAAAGAAAEASARNGKGAASPPQSEEVGAMVGEEHHQPVPPPSEAPSRPASQGLPSPEPFPVVAAAEGDEARYLEAVTAAPALKRWLALFQPKLLELLESRGLKPRDIEAAGWRLPIPAFDPGNEAHSRLVQLAKRAEAVAAKADVADGNGADTDRLVREALEANGVSREIDSIVIGLLLR
jgi:hypothetical protein